MPGTRGRKDVLAVSGMGQAHGRSLGGKRKNKINELCSFVLVFYVWAKRLLAGFGS
jgi:hypothetical protein